MNVGLAACGIALGGMLFACAATPSRGRDFVVAEPPCGAGTPAGRGCVPEHGRVVAHGWIACEPPYFMTREGRCALTAPGGARPAAPSASEEARGAESDRACCAAHAGVGRGFDGSPACVSDHMVCKDGTVSRCGC